MLLTTVVTVLLAGLQLGTIGFAYAGEPTNLSMWASRDFANQAVQFQVCNQGEEPIKEIVFDIDSTNFEFDSIFVSPFNTPPADSGTFDFGTMTWTGLLNPVLTDGEPDECIAFIATGNETGNLGDTVTTTLSIVSSVQGDDTVNADPESSDDSTVLDSYVITELPDLAVDSHLVTTGDINSDSEVEYQIDVSNQGAGDFFATDFFIFAFTLPEGASVVSIEDLDPSDALIAGSSNCQPGGVIGVDIQLPGLGAFAGRQVVLCMLQAVGNILPANDDVYSFRVKIVAGAALASGEADVTAIIEGNDPDTGKLFKVIASGADLLESVTEDPINNFAYLSYDPEALQVTINRCPGQGETTSDGTGCFRVSFNKKIVASSFTASDLNLGGVGSVSEFDQLDDYTWEVKVSGIQPGQTLTLLIADVSIQDYSAVQNGTQVLGINTIRFADSDSTDNGSDSGANNQTTAQGTLARTGSSSDLMPVALMLLIIGAALALASRKREYATQELM